MVASRVGSVLNERDTRRTKSGTALRPKLVRPRGILRLSAGDPLTGYARFWPDDDLAPFVEHLWTVEWDLERERTSEVLTHPSVQLVVERGDSRVAGVFTRRYTRTMSGRGRVLGVKFKPGGFRPFLGRSVAELTDRSFPLTEVFAIGATTLERRALAHPDPATAFAVIQEFLRRRRPERDPSIELVSAICSRAAEDREIVRVEQLAREFALGMRRLQRLFDDFVGVSPKWVIQRYRLHEASERIARGEKDWAGLAAELGYSDQPHFVRDFKRLVGETPERYARFRTLNPTTST